MMFVLSRIRIRSCSSFQNTSTLFWIQILFWLTEKSQCIVEKILRGWISTRIVNHTSCIETISAKWRTEIIIIIFFWKYFSNKFNSELK